MEELVGQRKVDIDDGAKNLGSDVYIKSLW